jgi:copper chaperone CopZ
MSNDVRGDQLALIKIEGMHCHMCERTIQSKLSARQGVREVEVDFASGQASVLFDRNQVTMAQLTQAVTDAGYRVTGFNQRDADAEAKAE